MNQSILSGIADSKVAEPEFAWICPLLRKHVSQLKGRDLCDVSVNNVSHLSLLFFGSAAKMAGHLASHGVTILRSQHWRIPDLLERCPVLTGGFLAEGFDIDGFANWRGFLMFFLVFCSSDFSGSVFWVFTCLEKSFSFFVSILAVP